MTNEIPFSLEHVNKEIHETLSNWAPNDSELEVEQIELASVLDRIKSTGFKTINKALNTSVFYCVREKNNAKTAIALVELVPTKKGSEFWLKMLNIYLSPNEFPNKKVNDQELLHKKLSQIFASIVSGVIQIGSDLPKMTTVKLYGRSNGLLDFFESVKFTLNEMIEMTSTFPGISITIEGRWLVLRATKKPSQV